MNGRSCLLVVGVVLLLVASGGIWVYVRLNEPNIWGPGAPMVQESLLDDAERIAFLVDNRIYVTSRDGGPATIHTTLPFDPSFHQSLAWSPDRSHIALDESYYDLFDVHSEETVQLIEGIDSETPVWSPDGSQLAFIGTTTRNGLDFDNLYLVNADGSNLTRLTDYDWRFIYTPTWSPDGQHLAFSASEDGKDFSTYRVELDGSSITLLTHTGGGPVWSPDGRTIVFGCNNGLCIMNADGTHMRQITSSYGQEGSPVWSPDSKYLVFTYRPWIQWINSGGFPLPEAIHMLNVESGERTRLTNGTITWAYDPAWSPDGSLVAFAGTVRESEGEYQRGIFVVRADASAMMQISDEGEEPVWLP